MQTDQFNNPGDQSGNESDTRHMTLGGGDFEGGQINSPLGEETSERRIKPGTLLLIVVVLVAGGLLFSMRTLAKVSAGVTSVGDFEQAIDEFIKGRGSDNLLPVDSDKPVAERKEVLEVLTNDYVERQVPLVNVRKNPFVIYQAPTKTREVMVVEDNSEQQLRRLRDEFEAQARAAAEPLKLKSVMGGRGPNPVANISGQIVRLGHILTDTNGVEFTVEEITADTATIAAENEDIEHAVKIVLEVNTDF